MERKGDAECSKLVVIAGLLLLAEEELQWKDTVVV